jgi:putative DNA methylase
MAYRKKLIEVALPLDAINAESAREKPIWHGHPRTLRILWRRLPQDSRKGELLTTLFIGSISMMPV